MPETTQKRPARKKPSTAQLSGNVSIPISQICEKVNRTNKVGVIRGVFTLPENKFVERVFQEARIQYERDLTKDEIKEAMDWYYRRRSTTRQNFATDWADQIKMGPSRKKSFEIFVFEALMMLGIVMDEE